MSSEEKEQKYQALQEAAQLEAFRRKMLKQVEQRLKKIEGRLLLHRKEREEAEGYPEAEYCAQLLQANFSRLKRGLKEIEVEDWKYEGEKRILSLQPDLLPKEQVNKAFKWVRKLKRRLYFSLKWIEQLEMEQAVLGQLKQEIETFENKTGLEEIARRDPLFAAPIVPTQKEKEARRSFRKFRTETGFTILVGKSDWDNDRLTFSVGRGNDLWFHAANFPGSHVLLQTDRKREVDEMSLQDAMQLALHFSKAKDQEAEEVIFTECKHLNKPKGAPFGKVAVSHHKKRLIRRDSSRLSALLSR